MQGVHRVIKSFSLFDVVSGSLALSISKSAALYKSLHALLFRDIELASASSACAMRSLRARELFHVASEAGLKVSPMTRQLLDAMAPVIPTGK
jgi:hypothetical protein